MGCQSGYRFAYDSRTADFDDVFVRKEYFSEGGLWLWGRNCAGSLGTGIAASASTSSSPIQTISGGTNWKQLSVGHFGVAGIKTDGTLWLWGYNVQGKLGTNSIISQSSPVQTVSGGTNWKQVFISHNFTAAIKTDGTLWTWGSNEDGQLGINSNIKSSSPVQTVSTGTNWKEVSVGSSTASASGTAISSKIAAIKTDGTLWLWGSGTSGQLGTNAAVSASSPVQTISGGTNWKQVSLSTFHAAAIKTDGTLWLWGAGAGGKLGINSQVDISSPIQTVSAGTNWKQVSAGNFYTAAIKTDGTLWTWGCNSSHGQLGDDTQTNRSSPVQTVSGGTNWKYLAAGGTAVAAIKTDGTLWTWGSNEDGELGDGTRTNRSSPVQTVSGGTNWKTVQVSSNDTNDQITAGIREDCW